MACTVGRHKVWCRMRRSVCHARGSGKKSVAFNLTLRADDRNLTAEEADEDVKSILDLLKTELDAVLR